MKDIKLSVGEKKIVSSGSIILDKSDEGFSFEFEDLVYSVIFKKDDKKDDEGKPRADFEKTDKKLVIILINFENPFGTSFSAGIAKASDGSSLHLSVFVHTLRKSGTRNVNYTLSIMEKGND